MPPNLRRQYTGQYLIYYEGNLLLIQYLIYLTRLLLLLFLPLYRYRC